MFCYCLLQGLPAGVTVYFLQYFLQDVVGKSPEKFQLELLGKHYDDTKSPESATALVNIVRFLLHLYSILLHFYRVLLHFAPFYSVFPSFSGDQHGVSGDLPHRRDRLGLRWSEARLGVLASPLSDVHRDPRHNPKLQQRRPGLDGPGRS